MTLLERIETLCKQKNYTIKRLEEESGLSNGQIGKWKKQKPSYDKVANIANTLNVSIDWLITGNESTELSAEEQELINTYKNTNDVGKTLIMNHAKDIQKVMPQEQQSTTSKIS